MASLNAGKNIIVDAILDWVAVRAEADLRRDVRILDVGACDGKWSDLIRDEYRWRREEMWQPNIVLDACEIFKPNAARILDKYDNVFVCDINYLEYPYRRYDIIIFGDVLEHMPVQDAQRALAAAVDKAEKVVVGVPFEWPQDEIYGNPWEKHIQADLTREIMAERYPQLDLVLQPARNYAYYESHDCGFGYFVNRRIRMNEHRGER